MAFNPFESFRKNSKAMLAVLTIFIMFLFVLSTGGGGSDFFDWFARQFGGDDNRKAVFGEIDGTEYRSTDLDEVRQQRAAANLFMLTAIDRADSALLAQIEQDLKDNRIRDQNVQKSLSQVREELQQIIQFGRILRMSPEQIANQFAQASASMYARANDPKFNERDNAAEIRNLRRAGKIFDHASTLMGFGSNGLFFGEIPNQNGQDALAFLMILKEADRMDLKFTDDDVKKLISDETDGALNDDKIAKEVDSTVRKQYKLSADKILQAIAQEYRMRTALTILRGRHTFPAAQTPFEMFEKFKDQCMRVRFEAVDLDIEKYLPLVTTDPTDDEVRKLYDDYAKTEYDPARSSPGFKKPRKVKIEYVGIDDSLPLYKKVRPALQAATTVAMPLQTISGVDAFSGAFFASSALTAEPLLLKDGVAGDPIITAMRQREVINPALHGNPEIPPTVGVHFVDETLTLARLLAFMRTRLYIDTFATPSDLLLYQPLPIASLTARLAVVGHPLTALSGAVAGMRNSTRLLDVRTRVATGMQSALAPLSFNPAFPFTASAASLANLPTMPESFWSAIYGERQRENKVQERQFALRDFNRLQERLNDIRKKVSPPEEKDKDKKDDVAAPPKKKDPFRPKPEDVEKANAEARALIDQFIKDRTSKDQSSPKTGKSEKLRDLFDTHNDPGLSTLVSLVALNPKPYTDFQRFFGDYDPKEFDKDDPKKRDDLKRDALKAKLYTPVAFPDSRVSEFSFRNPTYLAWRVEDEPEAQLPYDKITPEIKAQIVRAWKIRKARELATTDANTVAEKLNALAQKNLVETDNLDAFEKAMRDLVATDAKWKKLLIPIELTLLTEHPPTQPNTRYTFLLPTLRNPDILYPLSTQPDRDDMFSSNRDPWNGRRMAFQLLDARQKPLGETVIIRDNPEMHIYVNVLVKKTLPTVDDFYKVFKMTQSPNARNQNPFEQQRDLFYGPFLMEGRATQDRDMFARIKADLKFKETEELKKSLEKRGDGSSE